MTLVPIVARPKIHFAVQYGTRAHPWLAAYDGTSGHPWMARFPSK